MNVYVSHISAVRYWHEEYEGCNSRPRKAALTGSCRSARELRAFRLRPQAFGGTPVHIMVPDATRRISCEGICCHVCTQRMPKGSFTDEGGGLYVASPALALLQMAPQLSIPGLLLLAMEFCGAYRLRPADEEACFECTPLATAGELRRYAQHAKGFAGRDAALRALRWCVDGAASPMESELVARLCLPPLLGGYGCPLPDMNARQKLGGRQRVLAARGCLFGDLVWPQRGLVVEYNGQLWHSGRDMLTRDAQRANAVAALGLKMLTVTADIFNDFDAFDAFAHEVMKTLGMRQRAAMPVQVLRRRLLPEELRQQEKLIVS